MFARLCIGEAAIRLRSNTAKFGFRFPAVLLLNGLPNAALKVNDNVWICRHVGDDVIRFRCAHSNSTNVLHV